MQYSEKEKKKKRKKKTVLNSNHGSGNRWKLNLLDCSYHNNYLENLLTPIIATISTF